MSAANVLSRYGAVQVTMDIPASSFLSVRPGQVATLRGSPSPAIPRGQ